VSGAEVLLALLVLSYIGSVLVGGRTIRGFGLPSGAEYLVLGVVLGPHVLGVVRRSTVVNFETLFVVAAAWLALVSGLGWGIVGRRSIHPGRALVGVIMAVLVGAAVSGACYFTFGRLGTFEGRERLLSSLGAGAVGCETTRHAVRWVVERHGTRGPVSDWVADLARASAIVPVLWVALMFAMAPDAPLGAFTIPARFAVGLGIGVVLGLVAAVLLGREFRRDESWGILLGTSLLAAGVATRLGLAAVATLFMMGLTLSAVSRHRLEIKLMVQPTEKPMFLPVALVVGAYVDFDAVPKLALLVAAALAARVAAELVRGLLLVAFIEPARPASPTLGLGMLSTGTISLAVAFSVFVRLPGPASSAILTVAAAGVLLGEMLGPALLRRGLDRAGETHAVDDPDASPLSMPAPHALSDRPPDVH
jgi:Kef-type K+ transport system membrane component KefB